MSMPDDKWFVGVSKYFAYSGIFFDQSLAATGAIV